MGETETGDVSHGPAELTYGAVHLVTTCFVQPKEAGKIKPKYSFLQ